MPGSDFRGTTWPTLPYDIKDPTQLFPGGDVGSGSPDDSGDSTIPFGPEPAGQDVWSEEQASGKFYNHYEIVTRTQFKTGLKGAPKALPRGTGKTAIWRAHAGFSVLTVTWLAERLGAMPVLPHYDFNDPEYVLEGGEVIPESPVPMLQGDAYCYRVRGYYIYWMQNWDIASFYWPVATTRAVKTPAMEFCFGLSQFDNQLLKFLTSTSPPPVTF